MSTKAKEMAAEKLAAAAAAKTPVIETPVIETPKKVGVIATIVSSLLAAGKTGISKEEIHAKLVIAFPERASFSMMATVNVQVPGRINKERDFKLEKLENGNFRKAASKK